MRFKYYLRGIGIGIIVATLIMMIAIQSKGGILSDANAIKRAEQLGYVLAESGDADGSMTIEEKYGLDKESSDAAEVTEPADAEPEVTEPEDAEPADTAIEPEVSDVDDSETEDSESEEAETDDSDIPDEDIVTETVTTATITVTDYDGSESVSRMLENDGIIESANSYNNYLVNNGYSRRLQSGKFTVSSDMSYDEITDILLMRN